MSDHATMTGQVAGDYRILEKLGEGGMGVVYRAVDAMVERHVAIKVLRREIAGNPEVLERFRAEAVMLARLNHHSIATLYSFFRQGEEYFMVMEFVPGRSLEEVLRAEGAMPWRAATDLLLRLLDALEHAHQLGILHRDIKPANIMLTPSRAVKVTDFGIARVLGSARLTQEGRMVGTLEYLAPERVVGKPFDERSDLYAAGVVFYEMLSGRVPFESDSDYALIRAQAEQAPPPLDQFGVSVPKPVVDVVMKSLAKLPEERYPNAASMAAALREARTRAEAEGPVIKQTRLAEQPLRKSVKETVYAAVAAVEALRTPAGRASNRLWIAAAGAALVIILIVGVLVHRKRAAAVQNEAEQAQAIPTAPEPPPSAPSPGPVVDQPLEPKRVQSATPRGAGELPSTSGTRDIPAPSGTAVRSIRQVHTLVIERMPDNLDAFIRDQIRSQLRDRVQLVSSAGEADAIMRCDVEKSQGGHGVTNATGRVLGMKGHKSAVVQILDHSGRHVLWEEEVSDRRGLMGMHAGGTGKLAARIVGKLRKQLN